MSRNYGMRFAIEFPAGTKENDEIVTQATEAVGSLWSLDDPWEFSPSGDWTDIPTISAYGEQNLAGGESEHERMEKIYEEIKKRTGKELKMDVTVFYLEQIPTDEYSFGGNSENEEEQEE